MNDSTGLLAALLETIIRTYSEDDPRARARRFYPIYARIGAFTMFALVVACGSALVYFDFIYQAFFCMLYGMMAVPVFVLGSWFISERLYRITVWIIQLTDKMKSILNSLRKT